MAIKPEVRLKIRKFFKKYGKLIITIVFVWLAIIAIDKLLGRFNLNTDPTTTYQPHIAVLDNNSEVPKKVENSMEDFIKEYVGYCSRGEYEEAYNMISDDCKNDYFTNLSEYALYVRNKFGTGKQYVIQNYSNYNDKYIYVVKLYDDFLATGLTNETYSFQEEKITASYNDKGQIEFSVGNFIEKQKVQSVQENDYLKIDVLSKTIKYSLESYEVKITNKSDYTIVIKNKQLNDEILLNIGAEYRKDLEGDIILKPGQTQNFNLAFNKFYDDGDTSKSILFNSIRVVENYIEENPNEENSIYKFSMELGF